MVACETGQAAIGNGESKDSLGGIRGAEVKVRLAKSNTDVRDNARAMGCGGALTLRATSRHAVHLWSLVRFFLRRFCRMCLGLTSLPLSTCSADTKVGNSRYKRSSGRQSHR